MMQNSVSLATLDPRSVGVTTRGSIDVLDWVDGICGLFPRVGRARVPRGAPLLISGWIVDPASFDPPAAIAVAVDGARTYEAEGGFDRTDVQAELGADISPDIGFRIVLPIGDLTEGGHELRVYALGSDGAWYEGAHASFWVYGTVRPELGVRAGAVRLSVDNVVDLPLVGPRGPVDQVVPFGDVALITGWAVDLDGHRRPAGVCAIDERSGAHWSAPCDMARSDVRSMYGTDNDWLGFEILVPSDVLGRGEHTLAIYAFDAAGQRFGRRAEATFEVAAEMRPFPGFARLTTDPVGAAAMVECDGESFVLDASRTLTCSRGAIVRFVGWAAHAGGDDAVPFGQVFLELHPRDVAIPPMRYQPVAGFHRKTPRPLPDPPRDDAWFTYALDTANLATRTYDLRLAVVAEGRCFYARGRLGSVRVVPDESSGTATRRL